MGDEEKREFRQQPDDEAASKPTLLGMRRWYYVAGAILSWRVFWVIADEHSERGRQLVLVYFVLYIAFLVLGMFSRPPPSA